MYNIFSTEMSCFIKLFQLFGLFPSSFLLKIYSLIYFTTIIGIFISAFWIFPVLEDNNSLSLLVGGLVFVGILLTHLMNVLQAFTSRKEQARIYQKFDEIDLLLSNQLLVKVDYRSLRRRLIGKYLLIAITLFLIHIASIVSVTINKLFFNYYVHLILPVAVIRFRCIQNMFYVDLIRAKLDMMNMKLDDIIHRNHDKMAFIIFADKLQKLDKKKGGGGGGKVGNTSLYDQIMTLKQIYGKIFDVCNLINSVFGWSLLFIVSRVHDV
jgi:hypothetical protein